MKSILTTPPLGEIYIDPIMKESSFITESGVITPHDYSRYYIALGVGVILPVFTGFGLHQIIDMGETSQGIIGGASEGLRD
jgi:hypothetical protein